MKKKRGLFMKISFYFAVFLSFFSLCISQNYTFHERDMISDNLIKQINVIKVSVDEILKKKDVLSPEERNEFIHFVLEKDQACENITSILIKEFLQKKMLSDDENLSEKLSLVQKIIHLSYQLKINVNQIYVHDMETYIDDLKKLMAPKRYYQRDYNYYRYRDK